MARPQNRTMDSQPTPLAPYLPDFLIPAPGLTVPAPQHRARGACRFQRASSIIRMVSRSTSSATILRPAAPGEER